MPSARRWSATSLAVRISCSPSSGFVDVAPPGDHLGLDRLNLGVDDRGLDRLGLGHAGQDSHASGGEKQTKHHIPTEQKPAMFTGSG